MEADVGVLGPHRAGSALVLEHLCCGIASVPQPGQEGLPLLSQISPGDPMISSQTPGGLSQLGLGPRVGRV